MMQRMRAVCLLLVWTAFSQSQTVSLTRPSADAAGDIRGPDVTVWEAGPMVALEYSNDGNTLTTRDANQKISRWDVKTGRPARLPESAGEPPGSPSGATAVPLPPPVRADCTRPSVTVNRSLAAAGCADGKVFVWPPESGEPLQVIAAHTATVQAVAFSPDNVQFASASADGSIKVWETKTANLLATLLGHSGAVLTVAFSPNGRTIASGGADGTLRLWTMPLPPISPDDLEKIRAAIPLKATARPKKPRRLLVFWRADAIQHKAGVPAVNKTIELLARQTGAFEAEFSRDYAVLDPKVLARFDAILMNSTAHLAIPEPAQKQAFLDYVRRGGGVIGIHAAIDTFKDWPEGAEVIGATFAGHPFVPTGDWGVRVEEPKHPLTRAFAGRGFVIHDEVYEMGDPFTRSNRRVLLSLDLASPGVAEVVKGIPGKEHVHREDQDFAVSWIRHYGAGRVFYADFGHVAGPLQNPAIVQFYLDGIQWVLGDLAADDQPRAVKQRLK
jgi:type 1 glutamine amidotransferase